LQAIYHFEEVFGMSNNFKGKNSDASRILAQVPYASGFHFFTSVGRYTGETAVSLEHFAGELALVSIESVEFHFKRGDFQKWIGGTLGDEELAREIDQVGGSVLGDALRKKILDLVNGRIEKLKAATS
jgi:hypothetical protein